MTSRITLNKLFTTFSLPESPNSSLKVLLIFIGLYCYLPYGHTQATQGFEGTAGSSLDGGPCWFTDADQTAHTLANLIVGCGTIVVTEASSGSSIGYSIGWAPSGAGGNGNTGFSDGDNLGVANATGISNELGGGAPEGSNAFLMEDTDGDVSMVFDPVNIPASGTPMFSMQYHLESTGWEAADFLYIYLEITGCAAAGTETVIDTRGQDIDDLGIEDSWNTLNENLNLYLGCSAQLNIEHSSNSSSEELGIDNIVFTQSSLPVELARFTAQPLETGVQLQWETAAEINNEGFDIQHSTNGDNWTSLDFIEGLGNTLRHHQYTYNHIKPVAGSNYYRLKQMDFDGTVEYSPVRVIEWRGDNEIGTALTVFPNPAMDELSVVIPEAFAFTGTTPLRIFNQTGQLVYSENIATDQANALIQVQDLPNGFYFLDLQQNGQKYKARFIKQ